MFLRPHHFQAAQRHLTDQMARGDHWSTYYNWGLRHLRLDAEALANYRLVIPRLQARLRDGTLVEVPDDGHLPELDLKPVFAQTDRLDVFLAVPKLNLKWANVAADGNGHQGRYHVLAEDLEDENTGSRPQKLRLRRLNLKLLLSTQDLTGYETLPIARLQKSGRVGAVPEIDKAYVPPLLACDTWEALGAETLQTIYHRIGKRREFLANLARERNFSFESQAMGERKRLEQLRAVHEAYSMLAVLVFAQGVHPFQAYLELARLVGQLAIFSTQRDLKDFDLPRYDHDDLGTCFDRARKLIDLLLDWDDEYTWEEAPFVGSALRMQVDLRQQWLESNNDLYVGVRTPLPPEVCRSLLKGQLSMKIGSARTVDRLFQLGQVGLRFAAVEIQPQQLPGGVVYFQIDRQSQEQEWQNVRDSKTVAIRLQEGLFGENHRAPNGTYNLDNQRVLTVRVPGQAQTTTFQFTLFILPKK
jgi:type VI secretion system protein ImpJ